MLFLTPSMTSSDVRLATWHHTGIKEAQLCSSGELMSVGFQKVERFNLYTTLPPYGTLPKFLRARKETIFGRGLTLLELNLLFRHAETYHDLRT